MPHPDLPSPDSSSHSQTSGAKSRGDSENQSSNPSSASELSSIPESKSEGPKKTPNLELFPMPGMTISREDALHVIPEHVSSQLGIQDTDTFGEQDVKPLDTAVGASPPPPQDVNTTATDRAEMPDFVTPSPAEGPSHESFNHESLSHESLSHEEVVVPIADDEAVEEIATAPPTTQKPTVKADNPTLARVKNFRQKVTGNPVVQRVTAFRGWPWAIAIGVSGATTMSAFAWLAGLPAVPNCNNPASSWSESGRLYCADQAARKKEPKALASALEMVGDWDQDDPLYDQVNKLSDDWSRSILDVAQRELDQGKLNEAIQLAEKVPKSSSYYDESRTAIKDWQSNWKEGEQILEVARDAIQEQDWAVATDQMRQLVQLGGEHWQRRADKLISEMTIEQDAFRKLNVANDRAGYGTVSDIESAIQLATKIDAKRLARKKLMSYVDRWSEKLIDLADYYYEIGDYETAIEAAEAVPPGAKAGEDAIAYLQASRAQTVSQEDDPLGYIQAVTYVSQVPKTAEVHEAAQEDIEAWENQVQSWAQMEFAKLFTRVDQAAGYQIAIDHAALVDVDNPNRIEAQSLIAQWDKQRNSVADRQTIARASQLAQKTDLASVQAAIAEARRVDVDSPLRIRAQTLIAEWEGSIEKREDQPILDKANALARKGDLYAAIEMAEKIESDRALYDDAQDAIYQWVAKIQRAEDDPILDAAEALAKQGRYSEAIAKASEVGYGRALYYEAQDLIGRWIAERNRIEAARRPPAPRPNPSYQEEEYYEPEEQYSEPPADNYINSTPAPAEPYTQEDYVDSASGAGISGGPDGF